jgi:hypothetical protein
MCNCSNYMCNKMDSQPFHIHVVYDMNGTTICKEFVGAQLYPLFLYVFPYHLNNTTMWKSLKKNVHAANDDGG